jgi:hypothetical protein
MRRLFRSVKTAIPDRAPSPPVPAKLARGWRHPEYRRLTRTGRAAVPVLAAEPSSRPDPREPRARRERLLTLVPPPPPDDGPGVGLDWLADGSRHLPVLIRRRQRCLTTHGPARRTRARIPYPQALLVLADHAERLNDLSGELDDAGTWLLTLEQLPAAEPDQAGYTPSRTPMGDTVRRRPGRRPLTHHAGGPRLFGSLTVEKSLTTISTHGLARAPGGWPATGRRYGRPARSGRDR